MRGKRFRRDVLVGFLSVAIVATAVLPSLASAGSWTPAGAANEGRHRAAASLLQDGRVLVSGGAKNDPNDVTPPFDGVPLDSAEVYDAGLSTFTPVGDLTQDRVAPSAVTLLDGRVFVTGGLTLGMPTFNSEVFNPGTNTFSGNCVGVDLCDNLNLDRYLAAAALLPDGRVLIAGGSNGVGVSRDTAEIYNPATNTMTVSGDTLNTPRTGAIAVPLPDGRILIAGGTNNADFLSTAEVYNPGSDTFTTGIGSMGSERADFSAARLPDGRVLVAGGQEMSIAPPLASGEIFNPATNTWSAAAVGAFNTPRSGATAAPLADGRVLAIGGINAAGSRLSSAEAYSEPAGGGSPPPAPAAPGPTGKRAAALKKCKKKKGRKRKKCRKKAQKLPV